MSVALAARIYVALSIIVIAFQLALLAGAPWGELTMGGAYPGVLPARLRVGAGASAVVTALFAAIVLARSGLAFRPMRETSRWSIWLVVAHALIGIALHIITPSAREQMLWLPVVLLLGVCALVVARSRWPGHAG